MDISSYFVLEGSGDSEAPSYLLLESFTASNNDDDAESICCDSSHILEMDGVYEHVMHKDKYIASVGGCEDDSANDGEECNDQCRIISYWSCTADGKPGCFSMEEVASDGQRLDVGEVMQEMEDRVFWETCMAVGYP